jgi:hypothetical protein
MLTTSITFTRQLQHLLKHSEPSITRQQTISIIPAVEAHYTQDPLISLSAEGVD